MAAPQPRKYDDRNPEDRAWSSRVYQAARSFLIGFPIETGETSAVFSEICASFKAGHAALCNDSIGEPTQPRSPYWKHKVASALQTLKKAGVVSTGAVRGEWVWTGASPPPLGDAKPKDTGAHPEPDKTPAPAKQPEPVVSAHAHGLEEILEEHGKRIRASLQDRLGAMSGNEFQQFCGRILESLGYTEVKVNDAGPDEGVDGEAKQKGVIDTLVKFQAKRWSHPVGRPEIDKFRGAIQGKCHRGIFITTSRFSEDARQAAMTIGGVPVEMIDGTQIVNLMVEKRIGVKEEAVVILRLASL